MRYKRLPTNSLNTRDLGGIPVEKGVSKYGVYFRSGDLSSLTQADLDYLVELGVGDIIDLRRKVEIDKSPTPHDNRINYHQLNLSLGEVGDVTQKINGQHINYDLSSYYIDILESNQTVLYEIFKLLSKTKKATIFHCAAGKDRTGVVAMLLLALVGVEEADIVADYSLSSIYLLRSGRFSEYNDDNAPDIVKSQPIMMQKTLDYIKDKYGSVTGYISKIGVGESIAEKITEKFVATSH